MNILCMAKVKLAGLLGRYEPSDPSNKVLHGMGLGGTRTHDPSFLLDQEPPIAFYPHSCSTSTNGSPTLEIQWSGCHARSKVTLLMLVCLLSLAMSDIVQPHYDENPEQRVSSFWRTPSQPE